MDLEIIENKKTVEHFPTLEKNWFQSPKRSLFQVFLIKKIMDEKPEYKIEEERHKEENRIANEYAKKISDIIDDEKNKDIRFAIMEGNYEKAAQEVIEMLEITAIA